MLEWDHNKSEQCRELRGFGFDLAEQFDFSAAQMIVDERKDYGEVRINAFGRIDGAPFAITFTPRGRNIRIISMRRMHEKEARRYGI
ncbi:BrnT family toxin [Maritalea porphyrae]|uniref:BrnT family toxin n=1 Tax=Maritalea porphyrae TaxID=880732 RepID=UPI0022B03991|nr:BrnT family toxin [Maritalea porphyrae]MCZ4274014.1 BrnT family toxin [Maritalea porphyrae]